MHTSPKCVFRFCFLLCVSYVTGDNQDKTRNRREMHKTKIRISSSKKFGRNRRRTLKLEVSESENANFFLLCSRSCAFRSFRVHLLLLIGFSFLFFFFEIENLFLSSSACRRRSSICRQERCMQTNAYCALATRLCSCRLCFRYGRRSLSIEIEKIETVLCGSSQQRNGKMCNDFSLSCHSAFKLKMMYYFSGYLLNVNYMHTTRQLIDVSSFFFVCLVSRRFFTFSMHADGKSMHSNSMEWRRRRTNYKLNSNH